MKIALIICIVALAGVLGYLAEPSLRPIVTGRPANTGTTATNEAEGDVIVIKNPDINPNDYAPEQLPKTLKITYPTRFVIESSGLTVNMDIGSTVRLIRLEDNRVIVSPGDTNFKAPLPISNTDLLDQLVGITPIPPSERKQPAAPPITVTPPDTIASTDGETAELPGGDDSGETITEPVVDEGADDATVATTPEKSDEHLPPPAKSDVVAIMKNSIMEGQLKEFAFEQVTDWTAGDNETVDGLEFATGTVTYTTETLFGKKTIDAKAYITGKKVARWIWPKSGIELE